MKRFTFSVVFMVLLFGFIGQAADKPRFKVHVQVQCTNNPNIQNFIESHIKRGLRSLEDVDIVDFNGYTDILIEVKALVAGLKPLEVVAMNSTVHNMFSSDDAESLIEGQNILKDDLELFTAYLINTSSTCVCRRDEEILSSWQHDIPNAPPNDGNPLTKRKNVPP